MNGENSSDTAAVVAGSFDPAASPAKSLFLGNIVEGNIFPFPQIRSQEKETVELVVDSIARFLQDREREFAEFDEHGEMPSEYINSLKNMGLFGVIVPEEYGGIGLSNSAYARIMQETARFDASTSLTIGAHSSIGMKGLLLFGTKAQKDKYFPRLASGEMIAAFCLTEPGSGSDAASIKTRAEKSADGSWILNGEKIWITNGGIADFFTVFARTDSAGGKISAFIVERGWEGVSIGSKENKLGIRASSTTPVVFQNVKLPPEALLGEEGKGFKIAMSILNNGRTGLGGGCVGGMKRCIKLASEFARERKQFGKSISEFGLVKQKIAQMTIDCFAAESLVGMVGHYIDSGCQDFSVEAAMSKVVATENLWRSANEALQIAGGSGYMKEFPFERIVRDARINMIFEGTNEILRLYIGLSGMKDAGKYLEEIGKSVGNIFNDPIKGFGVLSDYAAKKLSHLTPVGRDRIESEHPVLEQDAGIYEDYTSQLAKQTESVLRKFGKNIIGRQFETKRLADCAADIFTGLCICSRVTRMIEESSVEKCTREINIAHTFAQQAKRRINQKLRRIDKNEDDILRDLSDYIVEQGGYKWDVF